MRFWTITFAYTITTLGMLTLLLHPSIGLLYEYPGAAIGVGLIGLGICQEVRSRVNETA